MSGLRERKKERTRRELTEAAMQLFLTRGYEETTVEDIAEVVGVSARTFFRYFDSKEAVLFGDWRAKLEALEGFLLDRPPDEGLLASVRALVAVIAKEVEAEREQHLFVKKIVASTPSAGDYEARVLLPAYRESFVRAVCARDGREPDDMRPALAAAVGMAAMHEAKLRWIENPRQSLVALTGQAFEALEGLFLGE